MSSPIVKPESKWNETKQLRVWDIYFDPGYFQPEMFRPSWLQYGVLTGGGGWFFHIQKRFTITSSAALHFYYVHVHVSYSDTDNPTRI